MFKEGCSRRVNQERAGSPWLNRAVLLGVVVAYLAGCSNAGIEPIPPAPQVPLDNLLRISGEVCTEPPDITPFPVKLLFVIDQSASLQCTDSTYRRFDALRQVIDDLLPLPNAYFGFVGFASWSRKQPFTRNQDEIRPFLDPAQGEGPATDYQGALASALQMLEQDMLDSGPAQRARTRYVVVFVSDGTPEPRCNAGCEDDNRTCADGVDSDGDGLVDASDPDCADLDDNSLSPDNLYAVCNTDREIPEGVYVDMAGRCPEYNQPRQIIQRVEELRTLELLYSAGEVMLNSVFISSPQEVVEEACPNAQVDFGYNVDAAKALVSEMARVGGGVFRDVNVADGNASFLDFDFTSLRTPYHATGFVAYNQNAISTTNGLIADTDADGLSDIEERTGGTNPEQADSDDNDGYSDLFETRYRRSGFDPLDSTIPALTCGDPVDSDGDGLHDCEEEFLNLDPRNPDTDGDQILDGLELRAGTDPALQDADRDPDYDGIINRSEIQGNTNPNVVDGDRFQKERVRYTLTDRGDQPVLNRETGELEERRCYDFDVQRLELVVTEQTRDRGRNRIFLHVYGQPLGLSGSRATIRQACIEVKYPGEGVKRPESGHVDVSPDGYTAIRTGLESPLDTIRSCTGLDDMIRPDLEDLVDTCLPVRQLVGRVLFHRDELVELVRRYYNRDLSLAIPDIPSDLFWPIEIFDPDEHCLRAWELDRVSDFMEILADACQRCQEDAAVDAGAETTPSSNDAGLTEDAE
ncbi:MAG: VWA domain-containing protein [Myxococcota bacterium]|nr:VWA domain-containing protein [Myxococcota bacterium]